MFKTSRSPDESLEWRRMWEYRVAGVKIIAIRLQHDDVQYKLISFRLRRVR